MTKRRIVSSIKVKKTCSLQWIFEPLERMPNFIQKKMFGCQAGYLDDRLVLVIADSDAPWNGMLIPTERNFHSALQAEFSELIPHPVLGKWLYLPQTSEGFEELTSKIIDLILSEDPRIGVEPKPKKVKKRKLKHQ